MMARKKGIQRTLIAPDGRKILSRDDFHKAYRERAEKRAFAIAEEHDRLNATRSLGSIQMQIKSCNAEAKEPHGGEITKVLKISATLPYSKATLNLITEHLQEVVVAEIKPKQILMNIQSKRGDRKLQLFDLPEEIQQEAELAVFADHDIKAAMEDLCVCGHPRRLHFEESFDNKGEASGKYEIDGYNCPCDYEDPDGNACECDGFMPLEPGVMPTNMMDNRERDDEGGEEDDDE